jgi:two-component system response regulator YesN
MDKEVQRACRLIEKQYEDPDLDLRKICQELVTGEAFLAALFVKELGLSVGDFIAQVRINRAKITLRRNPEIPAATLARSVGFADEKELKGLFERITGADIATYTKAVKSGTDMEHA